MKHILKIHDKYYEQIVSGKKTFEIRKNDRNYQVGDTIDFIVGNKGVIGNITLKITDVFQDQGFGLQEGFCILSFIKI